MTRKNLHRLLVLSTKIRHTKVLSLWSYLHIVQNQSKLIYEFEVSIEIIPLCVMVVTEREHEDTFGIVV